MLSMDTSGNQISIAPQLFIFPWLSSSPRDVKLMTFQKVVLGQIILKDVCNEAKLVVGLITGFS